MANFTLHVTDPNTGQKTPFFITGVESRDEAKAKLGEQFADRASGEAAIASRREEIKAMGIDLDTPEFEADTGGPLNRLAIGAGRSLTEKSKGAQQLFHQARGDQAAADAVASADADEAALFDKFDVSLVSLIHFFQRIPLVQCETF